MSSTLSFINGSFCPEVVSVTKQGRVLDGGYLLQSGLEFFHIGLSIISFFLPHTSPALPLKYSLCFSNSYSEEQFTLLLASLIRILSHHPRCSLGSQPP